MATLNDEVKRMTERFLCAKLSFAIPGQKFLSMYGGGEVEDGSEEDLEPPFTVVMVNEAKKVLEGQGLWEVQGSVQFVSHMNELTPSEHSEYARAVYHALSAILPSRSDKMIMHGFDISDSRHSEDEGEQARIEAFDFTAGVSG
jgi:hypothetical protein